MLTLLFIFFIMGVVFKIIGVAFKISFGILGALLSIIFWPVIIIGLVVAGLIHFAIPVLVIVGIVYLVKYLTRNNDIVE